MENRHVSFSLPLDASQVDVCSVRGVIFGSNDAGNSTTADIQHASGIIARYTTTSMVHVTVHIFLQSVTAIFQ